VTWKKANHC